MSIGRIALGLVGGVAALLLGVAAVLPLVELGGPAGARASAALGRQVTIESLRVSVGDPIRVRLERGTLANIAEGSVPDMARLERLAVDLDPWALLRGQVRLPRVAVEGLTIVLERAADGRGNWKMAGGASGGGNPRGALPTVLDLALADALVTMRTTGGNLLRIAAKSLTARTEGEDAPIRLAAVGGYNDTPITVEGVLESFVRLRDVAVPFGVKLAAWAPVTRMTFEGTMTDPVAGDGVVGTLTGDLARLDDLLAVSGTSLRMDLPLTLASPFTRDNDVWELAALTGAFAGAPYTGHLVLAEGARGTPDRFGFEGEFSALAVDGIVASVSSAEAAAGGPVRLEVEAAPTTLLDAQIGGKRVTWGGVEGADMRLRLEIAPGRMEVSNFTTAVAGGTVAGGVAAVPVEGGAAITAQAELSGVEVGAVLRMLGTDARVVSGRVAGRGSLALSGATLEAALATAGGATAVTITEGQVSRKLVQQASVDISLLFDEKSGVIPIQCFLVAAAVADGVAAVAPVRLRTRDGTILAGGTVDISKATVAMTMHTLSATTGVLALDLPIRISGPIGSPTIAKGARGSADGLATQGAATLRRLPAEIAKLAMGSGCAR